ncbi:serine/threonine-protein kinase VRK1 isoform X1 [Manacus vitellinus]|uniref:serine/threonine-protein kinase VRK1 isoform X1 n=1 Tax=Manacus vitellinus TaxID=328815 RepID=UPI00115D0862|nr:serine/threonine-protein kinase VRK1 isoform X1 [Manacus vitellinus]XP_029820126.1 serine/threonine-protein kinase VRK1 isoform X1 [Manacus vitellinus]
MPNNKKTAGKRVPAKRKLAEVFAPGEVLADISRKEWKLGDLIGQGGFGRLYLADVNSSKSVDSDAPYVAKVEPSENGPLFTELRFYMRAAKPDEIRKWTKSHKLKYLGVPRYWGSGLHAKNGNSYRFMIIDRFGRDLQKMYEENPKQFSRKTVLQLGLRILDILEYIHEHEYVHGDIKAANLLLSYKNPNQVYLVDYGLAYRYCPEGVHKVYKEDPKRCHDGTIEYTSIDAHKGAAPSRRGDLEILGYCMIHWLSGHLPWEDNLRDPNSVRDSKIRCRENISVLMDKCFPEKNKPDEIAKYMEKVKLLSYEEKPVYQHFREILLQGLKAIGQKDDGVLDFDLSENGDLQTNPVQKKRRKAAAAASESTEADMEDTGSPKKKKATTSNAIATRTRKMTSPKSKKSTATRKRVQK